MRLYILAALSVALVLAMAASLVGYGQHQNRLETQRDRDARALQAAVSRITLDEAQITTLIDQNRRSINNNSAQLGTSRLDISDLRALVAQTKSEVIRQLDGIGNVGPPTSVDTVAAKFLAILQRIDELEARIAALEKERTSPRASPSANPTRTPNPTQRSQPSPSPGEHCALPHLFCSSAG
jgi:chromosome segregation ATPase